MSSWAGFSQPGALPTSAIGRAATPALEVLLLVVVDANSGLQPNQSRWLISVPSAQACQGCAAGSVDVCIVWLMTGRNKSNNSIDIHLVPGFNQKRSAFAIESAGSGLVPKAPSGVHDSH
ncbi:unnamed protein product [Effrenium voratum]|uniref:Uncharacterized protein n=1 Tax=Effrenium voratum TaxID=2562239 RepID=A0AA36I4H5_9DINO|nr:unnamed protein product [Effrenium voratum]